MKIGFALIPEDSFIEEIIALEGHFHNKGRFLHRLGFETNLPHITLFQGDIDNHLDYKTMALDILDTLRRLSLPPIIHFSNISYVEKGWYFLKCDKTELLLAMHNFVLEQIKPYIILPPNRLERSLEYLTKTQYNAIMEYNYRYAGEAFYPHITIGRSKEKNKTLLNEMNNAISKLKNSSMISRITVYKMGKDGTHEETLYEIRI